MVLYLYFVKLIVLKFSIYNMAAVIILVEINFGTKKNDNYFSNRSIIFHLLVPFTPVITRVELHAWWKIYKQLRKVE
jgi:hypothetical protein